MRAVRQAPAEAVPHGAVAGTREPAEAHETRPETRNPDGVPDPGARWLLLLHQVPTKPDYLRVKVRRRLQRIGAVALKNAVYILPNTEGPAEDFAWLLREIVAEGGEGVCCAASLVAGLVDAEIEAMFQRDRDAEYAEITAVAAQFARGTVAPDSGGPPAGAPRGGAPPAGAAPVELARLRRRLSEVIAIDYCGAPGRAEAEAALAAAEARVQPAPPALAAEFCERPASRTWVTRRGVGIDRIASAWFIRRFIDSAATFTFVAPRGYRPAPDELRFDMYDAEYTHEGARCTFETLLARFGPADPALVVVSEIVHDIDLKDAAFGRAETTGVAALIAGLTAITPDDTARLARGAELFDALYAALSSAHAAALADRGASP